jgi:iron complex outermembrane receptor protein
MLKPVFKPRLLALAISAVLVPASLQAAVLEEVVVTAQKRAQSVQDVPIAITAFTGEQMEQLGFTSAQQITSMAPGVQTVQPNGEANYALAIRGVVANDFTTNVESPVALYLDEVYISQMSGAGFMLFDMERVEILRGPQGTLFGRNSTGGLAHFITKKPTQELDGYIKGTYGDYDQYKAEGAISGGNDLVAARFSGSYHKNDGYITNRLDKSTDLNNADDRAYRTQLMFTPTEDLEVLFSLRYGKQKIDTGFFENVSSVIPGKLTPNTFNPTLEYIDNDGDVYAGDYDDPGFNDLKTRGYTGTLKWSFDSVNLTSITDYSTTKRTYIEDSDASPVSFFNFFLTTDAEQFSQEIRLDGVTDNFKWVGGLYYLGLDIDDSNGAITDPFFGFVYDEFDIPRTPGSEAGVNNPYTSDLDSYSAFGQIDYALTDTINLVVGARFIRDEKDFEYTINIVEFLDPDSNNFDSPNNIAQPLEFASYQGDSDDDEWSGRVQLDWTPTDDLMLYASWNRGIRGGGFNAPLFPLDPPFEYDDLTMSYDPEQLDAYEVGFKSTLLDGIMRLNGAAYYYDYTDYQAFFIAGLQTITFNTDAESYGAELELFTSPIDGLDIMLGAAYNDIDLDAPGDDIPVEAPAGPTVKAPEWNLNALIRYEWPMFGGYIAAQGDIVYIDEHIFALAGLETNQSDSYSVSNVSLTYTTENRNWEVSAFVENVTDEEYLVQTFDLSGPEFLGMTEQYYGRPQWWGVSMTYRFGGE